MNKAVTQPVPVSAEEGKAISSSPTRIAVEASGGPEAVRRRDIAALLGGALGVLALSKCGGEPQNGASSQRSEQVGRLAQGLSGSDIKWVNANIGAPLNAPGPVTWRLATDPPTGDNFRWASTS